MKISFRRSACTIAAAILLPVTHAQGSPDLSGLLSILNSTPEGTWVQVNLNSYSEAWTPAELRPLYLTSNPDPSKITYAWPSFAWDSNRGDLILYGGGHANYSGNDVYRWHGTTRKWERAALPSELLLNPPGFYTPIDGPDAGPPSSHTYDNSLFLPIIDRFIVFGGAAFNTGGPYNRMNPDGVTYRNTGPYLFDPSKADPNKVGGTTGSHVKRVAPHPEIVGGNMWTNRDYRAYTFTGSTLIPNSHINGVTAYAQENGKDVVYFGARPGQGTDQHLFKYTISSLTDVTQDKLEKVGRFWNGPSDQGAGTYDPTRKLFVRTGPATQPITYWDLNNASPSNNDVVTVPVDASGTFDFNQMRMTGIDYDPTTDQYLIWYGGPDVWRLTPPTPVTSTGWKLDKVSKTSSAAPTIDADSRGILGKWKFIPNLNAFLGLQDFVNGNIWLFKPVGWKLPTGTGNLPPTVSLTSPSAGASFAVGSIVSVTATASDSDGSVTQVAFYVDGSLAATSTAAPYSASLTGLTAGTHSLTAVATDNAGAITTSAAVSITVTSATNTPPTVSLTSPAAGASF
ncbi:MAG TPA: Ig-like domain-containing protein, partial [Rhodocyclaceae bacterium]|nr:Ig-like domain-containing protein [Rhodocyclaceae bacterium]